MKTKIASFALIATILGGCTMPNLPKASDRNYQSSTTTTPTSVSNALANTQAPKDFREQFESAKPRLQEFLSNMACYNWQKNNKYMEVGKAPRMTKGTSNMSTFRYTKAECAELLRVTDIKPIAKNAFRFTVVFMAPDSEEIANYNTLQAIKQANGEWLFRW